MLFNMVIHNRLTTLIVIVLLIIGDTGSVPSVNQPKLCPSATWDPNGITFANATILDPKSIAVFVDTNNTVYIADHEKSLILMCFNSCTESPGIIVGNFSSVSSLFVVNDGDIYVAVHSPGSRVDKWDSDNQTFTVVMRVPAECFGLFVDINDNLYCSLPDWHVVRKRRLNDSVTTSVVVAGTGSAGSKADELRVPAGIFVDEGLNLYVADCENHRVQLFYSQEQSGETVAGEKSPDVTISLKCPTGVMLDADGYLLIVDYHNHRVVGAGPSGFRCLVGCNTYGSESNQLHQPFTASLESNGNLLVVDSRNQRIQKFLFKANSCDTPLMQSNYRSNLTNESPMYYRTCSKSKYYYETIQINVAASENYTILSESHVDIYGLIYRNKFDPFNPLKNLLAQDDDSYSNSQFKMTVHLQANHVYILVVTTSRPNQTGVFIVMVSGSTNVTLEHIDQEPSEYCYIGVPCSVHVKAVGLILDDILRYQISPKTSLTNQPLSIKISVVVVTLMFVAGLMNSILSFLTFQSHAARKVGCGLYLLASSATSLLTVCMFTVKFWFVVLTHINTSVSLAVLRGGCRTIEPLLKLCLSWDAWINACVAVERAVHVYQGVNFDKAKSKRVAHWLIVFLPCIIAATIIHEPLFSTVFEYNTGGQKRDVEKPSNLVFTGNNLNSVEDVNDTTEANILERHDWCVTNYSAAVQDYNTTILFVHLLGPFVANLGAALFIIFRSARRRSAVQIRQTFREHMREQLHEHRQLVISPAILLVLSTPRLIIALAPGCINVSGNPWLYLSGYLISFTPSVLVFIIYVLPSEMYRNTLRDSFLVWRRRFLQRELYRIRVICRSE